MLMNQNNTNWRERPIFPGWGIGKVTRGFAFALSLAMLFCACHSNGEKDTKADHISLNTKSVFPIRVSENHRYFVDQQGHPFFWLGDTGWLLLSKLNQPQVTTYLNDRQAKGFNVIQVMVIHELDEKNADGQAALLDKDLSRPDTATLKGKLNYWQGLDTLIAKAERRNMLVAMVPVWGSVVKSGKVSKAQATAFARFLAGRYHGAKNVVWLNGGDIPGSDSTAIWQAIGQIIKQQNPGQLMSFHPRGRTQSSMWFHKAAWLDFNCFQSGHRRYDQDNEPGSLQYGEDNYKYVQADYKLRPVKPTLDAEPSYEGIPQGLHDSLQPRWDAAAIRRYAYWSVFAGACGFTYGANGVMQFYDPTKAIAGSYGVIKGWEQALEDTASGQLIFLKNLLLSKPYLTRVPDTAAVIDQGTRYDYVAVTKAAHYALFYTPNGRNFQVRLKGLLEGTSPMEFSWFNPRNGQTTEKQAVKTKDLYMADPPGETVHGNDWVLIIEQVS